jgi:hypothetical protein
MSSAELARHLDGVVPELDDEATLESPSERLPDIRPGLIIRDEVLSEFQDYSGVTFNGPVKLDGVKFIKGFSFSGATFLGPVVITDVVVDQRKGSVSDFAQCKFFKTLRVKRTSLYLANFEGCTFCQNAVFIDTRFHAAARFARSKFQLAANFSRTIFRGAGHFQGVAFSTGANFESAIFRYDHCHARFGEARFCGPAIFNNAVFSGQADFSEAVFEAHASFFGTTFGAFQAEADNGADDEEIDRSITQADLPISFANATFSPSEELLVTFEQCRIGGRNFARDISFDGARFRSTSLDGAGGRVRANFRDMHCNGLFSLRSADFAPDVVVDFYKSRFEGDLDLSDCGFNDSALFEKVKFKSEVNIAKTRFSKFPDFQQATFGHPPKLYQAVLPQRASSTAKRERKQILLRLGTLRRLAAEALDKRTEFTLLVQELKLEGGIASRLYGIVSAYGQSWVRPSMWLALFALIIFPLLHLAVAVRMPPSLQFQEGLAGITRCADGTEGNAVAAAIELSIAQSMIVTAEDETRTRRIQDCLGSDDAAGGRSLLASLLEATQTILTLVLVFFIGAAVRRRLQLR